MGASWGAASDGGVPVYDGSTDMQPSNSQVVEAVLGRSPTNYGANGTDPCGNPMSYIGNVAQNVLGSLVGGGTAAVGLATIVGSDAGLSVIGAELVGQGGMQFLGSVGNLLNLQACGSPVVQIPAAKVGLQQPIQLPVDYPGTWPSPGGATPEEIFSWFLSTHFPGYIYTLMDVWPALAEWLTTAGSFGGLPMRQGWFLPGEGNSDNEEGGVGGPTLWGQTMPTSGQTLLEYVEAVYEGPGAVALESDGSVTIASVIGDLTFPAKVRYIQADLQDLTGVETQWDIDYALYRLYTPASGPPERLLILDANAIFTLLPVLWHS